MLYNGQFYSLSKLLEVNFTDNLLLNMQCSQTPTGTTVMNQSCFDMRRIQYVTTVATIIHGVLHLLKVQFRLITEYVYTIKTYNFISLITVGKNKKEIQISFFGFTCLTW